MELEGIYKTIDLLLRQQGKCIVAKYQRRGLTEIRIKIKDEESER